jgi:hypothetical protein
MATKAFYRSRQYRHSFPMRDILGRAQRALERGVPIGRGHWWQLPNPDRNQEPLLPNWFIHPTAMAIRDAMQECPPIAAEYQGIPRRKANVKRLRFPIEDLLDKFLKRHPEVIWKVPCTDPKEWAPLLFVKRQLHLMQINEKDITEEMAYQQVVMEGGGGGDWHKCELEHDLLKRVLRKTAQFQENAYSNPGMMDGYSLLREYMRLKEVSTTEDPSPFLHQAENLLMEKEAKRRELDCKLLAKMRNINILKEETNRDPPSWVEEVFSLKGSRLEEYKLRMKAIRELEEEQEEKDGKVGQRKKNAQDALSLIVVGLPLDVEANDLSSLFQQVCGVAPVNITVGEHIEGRTTANATALFATEEQVQKVFKMRSFDFQGYQARLKLGAPKFINEFQ